MVYQATDSGLTSILSLPIRATTGLSGPGPGLYVEAYPTFRPGGFFELDLSDGRVFDAQVNSGHGYERAIISSRGGMIDWVGALRVLAQSNVGQRRKASSVPDDGRKWVSSPHRHS